jgi:hypothetical protein
MKNVDMDKLGTLPTEPVLGNVYAVSRKRIEKNLTAPGKAWYLPPRMQGAIAQLGERLNGIQEVSGSIPLSSTNSQSNGVRHRSPNPLPSKDSGFFVV